MKIISKNNLCENRPYINLKKLSFKTAVRISSPDDDGFKNTYIIDQYTESLYNNENSSTDYIDGVVKLSFDTEDLNKKLLVDINYPAKDQSKALFKVYLIIKNVKYSLPFDYFEDTYKDCMNVLQKELNGSKELTYIKASFKNLKKEERTVSTELNLKRLSEFKDKVNYKRNVSYFVINNITSATSKYDINFNADYITTSNTLKVIRYDYRSRHYNLVRAAKVHLRETDIICDLSNDKFKTVSIYTEYGLGKLLDIKNNIIPNKNTISLFANILDLGIEVL